MSFHGHGDALQREEKIACVSSGGAKTLRETAPVRGEIEWVQNKKGRANLFPFYFFFFPPKDS
jgi:hypothetical protein